MRKQLLLIILVLFCLALLASCTSNSITPFSFVQTQIKEEFIERRHNENLYVIDSPKYVEKEIYPWEDTVNSQYPRITKEFFRCKGCYLNPVRIVQNKKDVLRFYDCGGAQKHSLPLKDQKEFIYPILIDLLNYLQNKTGKRVVITCGHCCPDHHLYLDHLPTNQASKHLLGAEVDFYVQGMEHEPEKVVELLISYYQEIPKYKGLKDFEEFKRYEKETNVSTLPWLNKEIFIKIFKKNEGRDFDNRHPYPYVCIQVRYDEDLKERVNYTWEKAFLNFQRW